VNDYLSALVWRRLRRHYVPGNHGLTRKKRPHPTLFVFREWEGTLWGKSAADTPDNRPHIFLSFFIGFARVSPLEQRVQLEPCLNTTNQAVTNPSHQTNL